MSIIIGAIGNIFQAQERDIPALTYKGEGEGLHINDVEMGGSVAGVKRIPCATNALLQSIDSEAVTDLNGIAREGRLPPGKAEWCRIHITLDKAGAVDDCAALVPAASRGSQIDDDLWCVLMETCRQCVGRIYFTDARMQNVIVRKDVLTFFFHGENEQGMRHDFITNGC